MTTVTHITHHTPLQKFVISRRWLVRLQSSHAVPGCWPATRMGDGVRWIGPTARLACHEVGDALGISPAALEAVAID